MSYPFLLLLFLHVVCSQQRLWGFFCLFVLSFRLYFFFSMCFQWFPACGKTHLDSGPANLLIQTSSFIFLPHQYIQKQFPFICSTGVVCVEDVSGAMLGFLSSWRLFQETVWGPAGLKQVRFQPTSLSSELWAVYQLLFQFVFEPLTFSTPNKCSFS